MFFLLESLTSRNHTLLAQLERYYEINRVHRKEAEQLRSQVWQLRQELDRSYIRNSQVELRALRAQQQEQTSGVEWVRTESHAHRDAAPAWEKRPSFAWVSDDPVFLGSPGADVANQPGELVPGCPLHTSDPSRLWLQQHKVRDHFSESSSDYQTGSQFQTRKMDVAGGCSDHGLQVDRQEAQVKVGDADGQYRKHSPETNLEPADSTGSQSIVSSWLGMDDSLPPRGRDAQVAELPMLRGVADPMIIRPPQPPADASPGGWKSGNTVLYYTFANKVAVGEPPDHLAQKMADITLQQGN